MPNYCSIPDAIAELKSGRLLIVVDSPDREDQADVIFPAETITAEKANFLIKECRGMFCVPMTQARAAELEIPLMVARDKNTEKLQCNFGVTVDDQNVTSHGISASDRCLTVKTLVSKTSEPSYLLQPGHVSPIIAADGGVLERPGHTEAAVDLARLAGFAPIGVLSEILDDDGEVLRGQKLEKFAQKHDLKIMAITDLIDYLRASAR